MRISIRAVVFKFRRWRLASRLIRLQIKWPRTAVLLFALSLLLVIGEASAGLAVPQVATIQVSSTVIGNSTRYIGACEGNVDFDPADIADLGINTYRLYGGMSRWETEDDDGIYGLPTISQIKQNPNLIHWSHWDTVMSYPTTGTDYAASGNPEALWQGNARTILSR